jgi:hypothetical protein
MPTRRVPTRRNARRHITTAAAEAFKAALPLRKHREEAIGNHDACGGVDRCPTCDEYENHVAKLAAALDLAPNEVNPIDVADIPAAPWFDVFEAGKWEAARRWYVDLCRAAGLEPSHRVEISDLHLGHATVRWIERVCRTPDGAGIGKRMRLRPFQRDAVLRIYGGGFGEHRDTVCQALGVTE